MKKQKIKLFGKPAKAISILSSGNTSKDFEKIEEIKQVRSAKERVEELIQNCNFKIINKREALRENIEKRKRTNVILNISIILSLLIGATLIFVGAFLNNVMCFIATGLCWMGSGCIYAVRVTLNEYMWPSCRYFDDTENTNIIGAELIVDNASVNGKEAVVKLVIENSDHTISRHSVTFPVIEKTDVTEYTLDLLEEKVYVPYVNN